MNTIQEVRKIHRIPEFWVKRRLEEVIEESKKSVEEVILFGPTNQSLIPPRKDQFILPRSQRPIILVNFVRKEIERFRLGESDNISLIEELRARFGYSNIRDVLHHLSKARLTEERRQAKEEMQRRNEIPKPSAELAWMLGVLSNGGYVHPLGKIVLSSSEDVDLCAKFKEVGEQLFKSDAHVGKISKEVGGRTYNRIEFHNVEASRLLGDLRRTQWPQTIEGKHSWILTDKKYIWSFLEGIFDTRGSPTEDKPRIRINTTSLNIANFIADLLLRVGIEDFKIVNSSFTAEKINGISIGNLKDLKFFAENVQSSVASKETILEFFRQRTLRRPHELSISNEEIIEEWASLKRLLGHTPSLYEILELRRLGKTKYSPSVYAKKFGGSEEDKSERNFPKARGSLDMILFSRSVNGSLREYQDYTGKQIRYIPKTHRTSEEEVKREFEKIWNSR